MTSLWMILGILKTIACEIHRAIGIGVLLWLFTACRLQAIELELHSPQNYQIIQRESLERGTLRIVGTLDEDAPHDAFLEVRIREAGEEATWRRIDSIIVGRDVRAFLHVAVGGWKSLDVRIANDDQEIATASVEHVGIGEVFVIAGQSNSANHGERKQQPNSGRVVAWDGSKWQIANDPQPGASGRNGSFIPAFGDAMVERLNVPIGVVACGIGATSVREWLPKGATFPNPPTLVQRVAQTPSGEWISDGEAFHVLVERMKGLGPRGFRAVLWHQGESDANQRDPSRTLAGALYREYLEKIIRDSRREVGWEVPWFVAQASYHGPGDEASPDIRAAQASLWKDEIALEGPDSDALKGDLRERGGQGVHFSEKGLRIHGEKWAEKVLPWVLAQPHSRLQVDSNFEGGNVEVVRLDEASQSLTIMPALRDGRGWPCWWSMRIAGLKPGTVLLLEVQPQTKPYSGNKVLDSSWCQPKHAWVSNDQGKTWMPTPRGELNATKGMEYKIPVSSSELRVAWGPPFVATDAEILLQSIAERVPESQRFVLAKTRGGRLVNGIRIGAENARHQVWINARHHAWETGGSQVGRGFIEWLASDEPAAKTMREKSCTHFVPIIDVDNVVLGAGGKEANSRDHNRDWSEQPIYPEVAAAQKMIRKIDETYGLSVYVDLHNPGAKDPVFFYGPFGYTELQGRLRTNYDRWLALAAKNIREPVPLVPEYRFATYVTTEEERGRMSSAWVRNHIGEKGSA